MMTRFRIVRAILAAAALLLINASTGQTQPGFYWANPRPTGSEFGGLDFETAAIGYAVGEFGQTLRTEDGGVTWESRSELNAGGPHLYDVLVIAPGVLLAAGPSPGLHRSEDGGITWDALPNPANATLQNLFRLNASTIFAAGDNGSLLRSNDTGASWTLLTSPGGTLVDQWWRDAQTGYVIGPFLIRRTTNGGQSWSTIPNVTEGSTAFPGDIQFLDPQNGWIFTDFDTFRTTNGGAGWFKLPFPSGLFPIYQEEAILLDAMTRLVGTEAEGADIWKTTNDGANWTLVFRQNGTRGVTDLHRLANGSICAITTDGDCLRSTDAGITWSNFTQVAGPDERFNLYAIDVAMNGLGFAGGLGFTWIQTTDAGRNWFDPPAGSGLREVFAVHVRDADFILAGGVGTNGQSDVRRSTNGGSAWTTHSLSPSYVGYPQGLVAFADGTCYCVTHGGDNVNFLYRSTDSGASWHLRNSGLPVSRRFFNLFFIDSQTGFVCGGEFFTGAFLHRTTNGGAQWSEVGKNGLTIDVIQDMHWFSASEGIVVGSQIQRTTNGGSSWATVSSSGDASIDFFDEERGVADDFQGAVRTTTDGGATWTPVALPMSGFISDVASTAAGFLVARRSNSILGSNDSDPPVAANESLRAGESFDVWPNPVRIGESSTLFFRLNERRREIAGPMEARLYDASGRLQWRGPVSAQDGRISLDSSALHPGVMFLELRLGGERLGRKVIAYR